MEQAFPEYLKSLPTPHGTKDKFILGNKEELVKTIEFQPRSTTYDDNGSETIHDPPNFTTQPIFL